MLGSRCRRWSVALSFSYIAFVRLVELLRLSRRGQQDLVVEVVMLRHEVAVLRRQVARDDTWASVGSDNLNRRSWAHDSELSGAVVDQPVEGRPTQRERSPDRSCAQQLRLLLFREHLDRPDGDDQDLVEPYAAYQAFAATGANLERWHATGRVGPRPPVGFAATTPQDLSPLTSAWATPLYRVIYDPDGRPRSMRRLGQF